MSREVLRGGDENGMVCAESSRNQCGTLEGRSEWIAKSKTSSDDRLGLSDAAISIACRVGSKKRRQFDTIMEAGKRGENDRFTRSRPFGEVCPPTSVKSRLVFKVAENVSHSRFRK